MKTLVISLFFAVLSTPAFAAEPTATSPFQSCSIQAGLDSANTLQISNDLLTSNGNELKKLTKNESLTDTFIMLKFDAKTEKVTLRENQEFNDLPQTDADITIQLGKFQGDVYASVTSTSGSAYSLYTPHIMVDGKTETTKMYLQHVTYQGQYADLRLSCVYKK